MNNYSDERNASVIFINHICQKVAILVQKCQKEFDFLIIPNQECLSYRAKLYFYEFFSLLPETCVLKICPKMETLITV